MWLTLVSVYPCPAQQRSWRPQGGGGGALQGSAQPEVQRSGEKFLKHALPSGQLGLPCTNKDMPKLKMETGILVTPYLCDVLSSMEPAVLQVMSRMGEQTSGGGNNGCTGGDS